VAAFKAATKAAGTPALNLHATIHGAMNEKKAL